MTLSDCNERRKPVAPRVIGALAVLAIGASSAGALPAPKSAETLEKESDVVATVRVLAVTRTGEAIYGKIPTPLPTYQALLQIVQATKGPLKRGETLLVEWHALPPKLIGGWRVEYFPGEEVKTYLRWDAKRRVYQTTWYNAKSRPIQPPDTNSLPAANGETIVAKRLRQEAKER